MVSDTTTTPASALRSAGVNPRPFRTSISSTLKYSGDTNLYSTGNLTGVSAGLPGAASATVEASARAPPGRAATTPRLPRPTGRRSTAWSIAERGRLAADGNDDRCRWSASPAGRSRRQGRCAETRRRRSGAVPRRPPGRPMSAFRARPGRASFVTSPRIVRTSSRRVAWSAGASPKNTVEATRAAHRNTHDTPVGGGRGEIDLLGDLRRHRWSRPR